ncbi:MAG: hypothetical protein ACRYFZ_01230 [Janthinobacterium lividum]
MNFLDFLKGIFNTQALPSATLPATPARKLIPAVNHGELYIASHLVDIELEAVDFTQRFGPDFNAFVYQPDVANFIRQQVLSFRYPGVQHVECLDTSHWQEIHYLNFPGPFYTGNSDTCDTGPYEAPNNVLRDNHAMEFVFQQPQNFTEFLCTLDAAAIEVLDSYSCDGNEHWTYRLCREWWRSKAEIIRRLSTPAFHETNGSRTQLYIDYLNGAAETDLRKYCYFLENGHYPTESDTLPPL